jgi:hypothetical protein
LPRANALAIPIRRQLHDGHFTCRRPRSAGSKPAHPAWEGFGIDCPPRTPVRCLRRAFTFPRDRGLPGHDIEDIEDMEDIEDIESPIRPRDERVMLTTQRLVASSSLTLALGLLCTQGCGGGTPVAEVPLTLAGQLQACAAEHSHHLRWGSSSISFDVKLSDDGQVDAVALRNSTLGDEVLELCMVSARCSFSEDDLLPLRSRSEALPPTPLAPESRALLGQPQTGLALAACLASPPCWITATFLLGAAAITVNLYVQGTSKNWGPLAKPKIWQPTKPNPTQGGPATTTGPTPPLPPSPPNCPRNESFAPNRTDNATGCIDKKGNVRCYSRKHPPCAGVHTHGKLKYQEIRRNICVEVEDKAVRCEGLFNVVGPCGSVPTVDCRDGGPEISGIFLE